MLHRWPLLLEKPSPKLYLLPALHPNPSRVHRLILVYTWLCLQPDCGRAYACKSYRIWPPACPTAICDKLCYPPMLNNADMPATWLTWTRSGLLNCCWQSTCPVYDPLASRPAQSVDPTWFKDFFDPTQNKSILFSLLFRIYLIALPCSDL